MNREEAQGLAALLICRANNGNDIVDEQLLIANGCSTIDDIEALQSALKCDNYNLFYINPSMKQYQLLHDAFDESDVIAHRKALMSSPLVTLASKRHLNISFIN